MLIGACNPMLCSGSNVRVRNITCECGNGLVPCIWPAGGPGAGGDIVNVSFEGARFVRSSMAMAIKSLPGFEGEARNISYRDVVLENVGQVTATATSTSIRPHFSGSLSPIPPCTYRLRGSTWCPCSSGADWCLRSDVILWYLPLGGHA